MFLLNHLVFVGSGINPVIETTIGRVATRTEGLMISGIRAGHRLMMMIVTGGRMMAQGRRMMMIHGKRRVMRGIHVPGRGKIHPVVMGHAMSHGTRRGEIVHVPVITVR